MGTHELLNIDVVFTIIGLAINLRYLWLVNFLLLWRGGRLAVLVLVLGSTVSAFLSGFVCDDQTSLKL